MSLEVLPVEEDGDEVFIPISAGCSRCRVWRGGKAFNVPLERVKRNGGEFWECPSCNGSYGPCA